MNSNLKSSLVIRSRRPAAVRSIPVQGASEVPYSPEIEIAAVSGLVEGKIPDILKFAVLP